VTQEIPYPGQVNRYHRGFDDPAHTRYTDEEILVEVRRVRDQIGIVFNSYAAGLREAKATTKS
jgi:arsenate reductase